MKVEEEHTEGMQGKYHGKLGETKKTNNMARSPRTSVNSCLAIAAVDMNNQLVKEKKRCNDLGG